MPLVQAKCFIVTNCCIIWHWCLFLCTCPVNIIMFSSVDIPLVLSSVIFYIDLSGYPRNQINVQIKNEHQNSWKLICVYIKTNSICGPEQVAGKTIELHVRPTRLHHQKNSVVNMTFHLLLCLPVCQPAENPRRVFHLPTHKGPVVLLDSGGTEWMWWTKPRGSWMSVCPLGTKWILLKRWSSASDPETSLCVSVCVRGLCVYVCVWGCVCLFISLAALQSRYSLLTHGIKTLRDEEARKEVMKLDVNATVDWISWQILLNSASVSWRCP